MHRCTVLLGNHLCIPLLPYSSLPPSLSLSLSVCVCLGSSISRSVAHHSDPNCPIPIISTFFQPEAPIRILQRWTVRPQSVQARLTRREPNSVRPLRLNPTSSSLPPPPRNGKPKALKPYLLCYDNFGLLTQPLVRRMWSQFCEATCNCINFARSSTPAIGAHQLLPRPACPAVATRYAVGLDLTEGPLCSALPRFGPRIPSSWPPPIQCSFVSPESHGRLAYLATRTLDSSSRACCTIFAAVPSCEP